MTLMSLTAATPILRTTYAEARAELLAHLEAGDGTIEAATLQAIARRCEEEDHSTIPVGPVYMRLADEGCAWREARGLDPDALFVGDDLD